MSYRLLPSFIVVIGLVFWQTPDLADRGAGGYARPWTLSVPLISPPGFELLLYECHEGNVAVMSDSGRPGYRRPSADATSSSRGRCAALEIF